MAFRKRAKVLAWVDIEGTGLDPQLDSILEIGLVITDMKLNELARTGFLVKITPEGVQRLRDGDEYVVNMHKTSGLLAALKSEDDQAATIEAAQQRVIDFLSNGSLTEGEYMLAGSGVLHYDLNFIKAQLPEVEPWFTYYALDMGVLRRGLGILMEDQYIVPKVLESYQDGAKAHRALDDALAHVEEARQVGAWLKAIYADAQAYREMRGDS